MDFLQLCLMKLLPKKSISRLVGKYSNSRWSKPLIKLFASHYNIDTEQAEFDLAHYSSLTEFFIRRLKPGLRPIIGEENSIISPVDGVVSQFGAIHDDQLIQAKGINYSVRELLGQDQAMTDKFHDGMFVTIYLSPKDYHRIHSPLQARVIGACYVPGTLFPVNPFGVRAVRGLFARNERLVTYLNSPAGYVALVKVGATIVGSVKVNYADIITNLRKAKLTRWEFTEEMVIAKGDELGRFEFGSTVILLFQKDKVALEVERGQRVLMGQAIGNILI